MASTLNSVPSGDNKPENAAHGENGTDTEDAAVSSGFVEFASNKFLGGTSAYFSRKELKHQLLRATGDADKRVGVWHFPYQWDVYHKLLIDFYINRASE